MPLASQPPFFAILIGIDNYPQRPISSCVRDVRGTKRCLIGRAHAPATRLCVATLTSCGLDPTGSTRLDAQNTIIRHDVEDPAIYSGILESL